MTQYGIRKGKCEMKKRKMRVWKIMAFVIPVCAAIGFGVSRIPFDSVAKQGQIAGCEIEKKYSYGEEFILPTGNVSYAGEEKAAEERYLVYPSGKANKNDKLTLSEEGQYEVVFTAKFGNVPVTASRSFIVNKRLLAVNDEKSSAILADDRIQVSLVSDDVFTYNEALDLSESGKDTPLISIGFTPNVEGTADAGAVKIRLTDLYDETNYVEVKLQKTGSADGVTYLSAGAADQPSVGVENTDHPDQTKIFTNDLYGAAVYHSMTGRPESSLDAQLKLYYDAEDKAFYADREVYSGGQIRMVTDLDNMEYYGENTWDGFTTGEVKLSVYAESYQSVSCNFYISQINGLTEFDTTGDVKEPTIRVKTEYKEDEIPTALVGKPYLLFDAEAVDNYDGKMDVETSVYYRYYSDTPVNVSVTDGAFVPTEKGSYVIEYAATDASGNRATKCVKVEATEGEGLSVKVKDPAVRTLTGESVKLLSGIQYKNNSGNVSYTVRVGSSFSDDIYEVDSEQMTFCPMQDGTWEVTVEAKDYIQTVTETYTLQAEHTTQPQVYDMVGIQDYFILGATYEMPELSGYDFSSGKGEKTKMELFVTEGKGSEKQLADMKYVPEKTGKIRLTYRQNIDGKVCEKTYQAQVVDVGYTKDLNLSGFFVTSKGKAKAESSATAITYRTDQDTVWDFVNFVQTKKFSYAFQAGAKNAYKKVNLYLTDTVTGKRVKFTFKRTKTASVFSVNDGAEFAIASTFDGKDRNFKLEYDDDTHMILASNTLSLEVKNYTDGSTFAGFTGNEARFSVELAGVTGTSEILMSNINSHSLNNTRIDRFPPEILVDTKSGDRGVNEILGLTGAFAYDTIDPICTLSMEVVTPGGTCAVSEEGVKLDGTQDPTADYSICLKEYGDYTIKYVAADGKGKSTEYTYAVTSKDVTGPELVLKRHKTTAKQGKDVKVADTKVTDDISKKCTVECHVFDPEGSCVTVTDGKFKADKKGTYRVKYMAFDESGNYTFASYQVEVK